MAVASSIDCSSADCSRTFFSQPPSLVGNAVLLALFAALIPGALVLGTRYKGLWFAGAITIGLSLEVAGYVGRLLLRGDPTSRADFAVFLAGTTLGPTCICGAIFSIVPRIVAIYGEQYRSWRPVWYLLIFSVLTVVSLVLEFAGSVISTIRDAPTVIDTGPRLLVAGLAVQLVALIIFAMHAILFSIALRMRQRGLDPEYALIYTSGLFKSFLFALTIATALVVLRTAYRTVQIAEGFQSSIARAETLFLVLDGAAVLASAILLLAFFPGRVFGRSWSETSIRRMSPEPRRQIYPVHDRFPISCPSQTYDPMSMKSPMSTYSPMKTNYSAPSSQRYMVDSDNLW
ncbi:hypothetical protein F5Y10DRAFT_263520 [Nemania abortiva]|nr:hypothetical protein F5Y10DRAFT_263520 [Nemania abortiva]